MRPHICSPLGCCGSVGAAPTWGPARNSTGDWQVGSARLGDCRQGTGNQRSNNRQHAAPTQCETRPVGTYPSTCASLGRSMYTRCAAGFAEKLLCGGKAPLAAYAKQALQRASARCNASGPRSHLRLYRVFEHGTLASPACRRRAPCKRCICVHTRIAGWPAAAVLSES